MLETLRLAHNVQPSFAKSGLHIIHLLITVLHFALEMEMKLSTADEQFRNGAIKVIEWSYSPERCRKYVNDMNISSKHSNKLDISRKNPNREFLALNFSTLIDNTYASREELLLQISSEQIPVARR